MHQRPTATAAASPVKVVTTIEVSQRHPRARRTDGVRPATASQAAISSAAKGGAPTSGSARFNPANIDTTKRTWPTHGHVRTTVRYQGSIVVSRPSAASSTRSTTLGEPSVVAAQ
jgi:hypothetical protein